MRSCIIIYIRRQHPSVSPGRGSASSIDPAKPPSIFGHRLFLPSEWRKPSKGSSSRCCSSPQNHPRNLPGPSPRLLLQPAPPRPPRPRRGPQASLHVPPPLLQPPPQFPHGQPSAALSFQPRRHSSPTATASPSLTRIRPWGFSTPTALSTTRCVW